jgi:hypothetical protein
MGAMLFYLRAIQTEEASVVAPLFQANNAFSLSRWRHSSCVRCRTGLSLWAQAW